jgi:hypothetical protein
MTERHIAVYYAWSRPGEINAPLSTIENRFPALFESRRMLYPQLQELSDPTRFDQGIGGFLSHILKKNYDVFVDQTKSQTTHPVVEIERIGEDGVPTPLDDAFLKGIDTLIVISFDSLRTDQAASAGEIAAVRAFLEDPDHLLFVCPHHDIGEAGGLSDSQRAALQEAQFLHHGDRTLPPQQGFGGFGRTLLAGLGVAVENRFGLHPAAEPDGLPAPFEAERALDRLSLLKEVTTFNLHPHLPHFEPVGDGVAKFDVLVRQFIDPKAPPHPFTEHGRRSFDALLQTRAGVFAGTLLVGDATLWSSLAGGVESLQRFWTNIVQRPLSAKRTA